MWFRPSLIGYILLKTVKKIDRKINRLIADTDQSDSNYVKGYVKVWSRRCEYV